jgi:hypothetical protein
MSQNMTGLHVLHTVALVMQSPEVKAAEPFMVTKSPAILGSCFALRQPTVFLTARHVIKGHDPSTLAVSFVVIPGLRAVTKVHIHPTADLAILEAQDPETGPIQPITDILAGIHLGEPFAAFGFPEDLVFGGKAGGSPHRLLMGHYSRFFEFESAVNQEFRYVAGEMNVPVPKGMSGGPLLRPEPPYLVTGLAAETNYVESYPTITSETIVDGQKEKYVESRMIAYGVAVILGNLIDWINERVPPR